MIGLHKVGLERPMVRTLHARLLTLGGVALTTALSGLLLWPSAVYAFGGKYHIGEAGFSNIHKSITYTAFWFMDRRMTSAMAVANHHQDNHEIYGDDCSHHSCNCQFRQASNWYNSQYRAVIDLLKEPLKPSTDTYPAYYFGMALHGIQDFYAHANWVPKYPNGLAIDFKLIDEGVGEWPLFEPYKVFNEKLMIIQGDPPADVKVRLPVNSIGKVISAVPVIEDRRMYLSPAPPAHVPLPPIIAGEFQRAPTADGIRAEESAATVTAEPGERSVSEGGGSPTRERPPTAQVRKYYGVMTAGSLVAESGRSYFPEQQCHPVGSNCKEDSDASLPAEGESRAPTAVAFEGEGT